MSATSTSPSGLRLLEAVGFNRHIAVSLIATRDDDWQELLASIPAGQSRRNVAAIVWQIREALGKDDFDYAREIAQGE